MKKTNSNIREYSDMLAKVRYDGDVARRACSGDDCLREFSDFGTYMFKELLAHIIGEERAGEVRRCADLASVCDFVRREFGMSDVQIAGTLRIVCDLFAEDFVRLIGRKAAKASRPFRGSRRNCRKP